MAYLPPKDLAACATLALNEYQADITVNSKSENSTTKKQIAMFVSLLKAMGHPEIVHNVAEKKEKIELGIWIFLMALIGKEYGQEKPFFTPGYFRYTDKGSKLFTLLFKHLAISEENPLSCQEKIICLEHLYNFLLENKVIEKQLSAVLASKELKLSEVQDSASNAIHFTLLHLQDEVNKLVKAPPTDLAFEQQLSHLYQDYKTEKAAQSYFSRFWTNPNRKMYAQLAEVVAYIAADLSFPISKDKHEFNRKRRIENGVLFFIAQIITSGVLYERCRAILHRDCIKDIDVQTQIDCLCTFRNFIGDMNIIAQIENAAEKKFGDENLLKKFDNKVHIVHKELDSIIQKMLLYTVQSNWPIVRTCAYVGAMIASAPGYGLGYAVGSYTSETSTLVPVKTGFGDSINYFSALLGFSKSQLGFWAAGFLIQPTLTRAFAKLLEKFGQTIGYVVGGTAGLIPEFTYRVLQGLCKTCTETYDPSIASEVDIEFVRSLSRLPEKIFNLDKKNQIKSLFVEDFLEEPSELYPHADVPRLIREI